MRFIAAIFAVLLSAANIVGAAEPQAQPTARQYMKRAVGPGAVVRAGLGAAITQGTNTPSEWGQGAAGFGKRLASAFGKHLVKKAIQYPVAQMRHEALGYERSNQTKFRPMLAHALLATVITRNTTTGKKTVATNEIAGAVGSGFISRLWQPASVRTVSAGFASAGITLGVDAGSNVLREFWPEIRHPHSHRRAVSAPKQPRTHASNARFIASRPTYSR